VRPLAFRVLGPLEVLDGDRALAFGGSRQRALLAMLLLHANELVSADRLIDALWGAAPPPTAAKTIQVYVSRLRKELGDGRLVTQAPGYALQVDRSELDLAQFEQLLGEAQRSEPARAADTLRRALALWRGPALADLAYESFAQPEIARLEELRWAALEQRIDADLAAGHHAELVGELGALVAEHPLRERLRGQLMLALYRSGRQAEALNAYRQARRELSDELGLEPSEELRQLEQAILRQDPALEPEREALAATTPLGRSLLLAPRALGAVDALVALAEPLAASDPPRELIVAAIVDAAGIAAATAALAERREHLLRAGVATRAVAFSSRAPGRDVVRLAGQENVDLLVSEIAQPRVDDDTAAVLEQASCDVALLVGAPREGPVLVPFGGAWHDWAALEVGAWVARATGARLRLIGALGTDDAPDASRLLADASLIVQRTAGIVAEPLLAPPGRGVLALAEGAGLLVVGFSERWRQEGLGRVRGALVEAPPAPTVLVRRGPRPGGLAPPETVTRFGWSLTS
jgi:DNA-binding SARP family transcriptional activator